MLQVIDKYYKRDFWIKENLLYVRPHFRLEKCARIINRIARGEECDLLDVGCGPAALTRLLHRNIHYHGIDIAIHSPASNLIQTDFLEGPIAFSDMRFDIIVAQGVFEYVGDLQPQKLAEIAQLLNDQGKFIVSYVNFDHPQRRVYPAYNNIQSLDTFKKSLARFFHIERFFPTSHHWHHHEPNRSFMKAIQMHANMNIPFISRRFAIQYLFICSALASHG